jgi:hypothetical protein
MNSPAETTWIRMALKVFISWPPSVAAAGFHVLN